MGKITVVGMGPGDLEQLTTKAKNSIFAANVLIGTGIQLELINKLLSQEHQSSLSHYQYYDIKLGISEIMDKIADSLTGNNNVVVMVSGDPGFYSLFSTIKEKFSEEEIIAVPGISSLQMGLTKIRETWEDAITISLHGREHNLPKFLNLIDNHPKIAVLLGGKVSTHYVKDYILKNRPGFSNKIVYIMANLSLEDEAIIKTNVKSLSDYADFSNCIIFFPGEEHEQIDAQSETVPSKHLGITGHELFKGDVPMTKEEIRAVIISKLQLFKGAVLWDIGAGTGSISLQTDRLTEGNCKVYAIEQSDKAYGVLIKNIKELACEEVKPIYGQAPEILTGLRTPDRIVIGGSGGNLPEILVYIDNMRPFQGTVVIPTVTLDSFLDAYQFFKDRNSWDYQIQKIQVSRAEQVGKTSLWKSDNPITIITATKQRGIADETA